MSSSPKSDSKPLKRKSVPKSLTRLYKQRISLRKSRSNKRTNRNKKIKLSPNESILRMRDLVNVNHKDCVDLTQLSSSSASDGSIQSESDGSISGRSLEAVAPSITTTESYESSPIFSTDSEYKRPLLSPSEPESTPSPNYLPSPTYSPSEPEFSPVSSLINVSETSTSK